MDTPKDIKYLTVLSFSVPYAALQLLSFKL